MFRRVCFKRGRWVLCETHRDGGAGADGPEAIDAGAEGGAEHGWRGVALKPVETRAEDGAQLFSHEMSSEMS